MAKNKVNLRDLSDGELEQRSRELIEELFNLRFQVATKQLADSTAIRKARKNVARILTVLRERELLEQLQQRQA